MPRLLLALFALMISALASCDDEKTTVVRAPSLPELENKLSEAPEKTGLIASQQDSDVPWQPWSKEVFELATERDALVFAFIGDSDYPSTEEFLSKLDRSNEITRSEIAEVVPTLIDLKVNPEMRTLLFNLLVETEGGGSLPGWIWFTSAGHPVSWGYLKGSAEQAEKQVTLGAAMVFDVWASGRDYVLGDSRSRTEKSNAQLEENQNDLVHNKAEIIEGIRSVSALYNSFERELDLPAPLVPLYNYELLLTGGQLPGLADYISERSGRIGEELVDLLLESENIDPLDGLLLVVKDPDKRKRSNKSIAANLNLIDLLLSHGLVTENSAWVDKGLQMLTSIESLAVTPAGFVSETFKKSPKEDLVAGESLLRRNAQYGSTLIKAFRATGNRNYIDKATELNRKIDVTLKTGASFSLGTFADSVLPRQAQAIDLVMQLSFLIDLCLVTGDLAYHTSISEIVAQLETIHVQTDLGAVTELAEPERVSAAFIISRFTFDIPATGPLLRFQLKRAEQLGLELPLNSDQPEFFSQVPTVNSGVPVQPYLTDFILAAKFAQSPTQLKVVGADSAEAALFLRQQAREPLNPDFGIISAERAEELLGENVQSGTVIQRNETGVWEKLSDLSGNPDLAPE